MTNQYILVVVCSLFSMLGYTVENNDFYVGISSGIGNYNTSPNDQQYFSPSFSYTSNYVVDKEQGDNLKLLVGFNIAPKQALELSIWKANDLSYTKFDFTSNGDGSQFFDHSTVNLEFKGVQISYLRHHTIKTNLLFDYRIGAVFGQAETSTLSSIGNTIDPAGFSTSHKTQDRQFATAGLGLEFPMKQHFSLRLSADLYNKVFAQINNNLAVYSLNLLYRP